VIGVEEKGVGGMGRNTRKIRDEDKGTKRTKERNRVRDQDAKEIAFR
jgi:hypothetical protein